MGRHISALSGHVTSSKWRYGNICQKTLNLPYKHLPQLVGGCGPLQELLILSELISLGGLDSKVSV